MRCLPSGAWWYDFITTKANKANMGEASIASVAEHTPVVCRLCYLNSALIPGLAVQVKQLPFV